MIRPALQNDAFLADVNASRADTSDTFRTWWLGQSGFLVQWRSRHLLIDPYLSDSLTKKYATTDKPHVRLTELVVAPQKLNFIDVVTSSHNHTDHLDADTLKPIFRSGQPFVIPEANRAFVAERCGIDPNSPIGLTDGQRVSLNGFEVIGLPAAHNELEVDSQGRHKFMGLVIRFGRWTIYHAGDTLRYDGMVERLRKQGPIDVALLPINGNKPERRVAGNLDGHEAAQLAKDIGAKIVIPMHYEMFEFNTADPRELFIPECKRLGQPFRVLRAGERFSSDEIPKGHA